MKPGPKPGYRLTEEHRASISASRRGQCTPEQRKSLESVRASRTTEQIQMTADAMRRWNDSPEGIAQRYANLDKIRDEWLCSPENLANLRRVHDSWARTPEGLAQALSNYPGYTVHGRVLRERDGDICQLCLGLIDFNLKNRDPMSVSVDHITPRRAGGTDDLENLWLAHLICNMKKGARHHGRSDGSTDSR